VINIRKFIAIATVGATVLGFSSMASAQKVIWHGPIYRPVHVIYNPVRYAPVPIPPFGIYEQATPIVIGSYAYTNQYFYPVRHTPRWHCR
jgi:hypothetical protein